MKPELCIVVEKTLLTAAYFSNIPQSARSSSIEKFRRMKFFVNFQN